MPRAPLILFASLVACSSAATSDSVLSFAQDPPPPDGPVVAPPPLSTLPPRCFEGNWCWMDPLPFGDTILSLEAERSTNVWATGDNGLVLHFDGAAWSYVDCGTSRSIAASSSSAPDDAWFVSDVDVLHWNGKTCARELQPTLTPLPPPTGGEVAVPGAPTTAPILSIWSSGPDDVFACDGGSIFHFDGTAWSSQPVTLAERVVPVLSGSSRRNAWLFGGDDPMHWDGSAWASVHSYPTSGTEILFTGTARRTDSIWALTPNSDEYIPVGSGGAANTGEAEPQLAQLFSGDHWTLGATLPAEAHATSIASGGPGDLWINGPGIVQHLVNGTWQSQPIAAANLHATTPSDVWGTTFNGIQHFDGIAWTTLAEKTVGISSAIAGSSSSDIWVSLREGASTHYDGKQFTRFPSEQMDYLWVASPTAAWGGGQTGISQWDGTSWKVVVANFDVQGVSGSSPSDVWATGFRAGAPKLAHYDGAGWSDVTPTSVAVTGPIWVNGPDDVWAVAPPASVDDTAIAHFDGHTWTTQALPPIGLAGSLDQLWSSGPSDVWAAGYMGGAHFDGTSWQQVPFDANETSRSSVSGSGPDDVTIKVGPELKHWNGQAFTTSIVNSYIDQVWVAAPGETWALGEQFGVLRQLKTP